jgi:hypothetical protein
MGYSKIGTWLAGRDWEMTSAIIEAELESEDHTYVEYSI